MARKKDSTDEIINRLLAAIPLIFAAAEAIYSLIKVLRKKGGSKKESSVACIDIHKMVMSLTRLNTILDKLISFGEPGSTTSYAEAWHQKDRKFKKVHVGTLINNTKGRKIQRVDIASLDGPGAYTKGFTEKRVRAANTKYPLLVDSYHEKPGTKLGLIDGRHRRVKMIRRGIKHANVVKITDADIDKAEYP